MEQGSLIPELLRRLAGGDGAAVVELLYVLSDHVVTVPVERRPSGERRTSRAGTPHEERVRIPPLEAEGRTVIPVFTSTDLFLDWSDGRYQPLSLVGADLALVLPKDRWLSVDPGQEHNVSLPPKTLPLLADPEQLKPLLPESALRGLGEREYSHRASPALVSQPDREPDRPEHDAPTRVATPIVSTSGEPARPEQPVRERTFAMYVDDVPVTDAPTTVTTPIQPAMTVPPHAEPDPQSLGSPALPSAAVSSAELASPLAAAAPALDEGALLERMSLLLKDFPAVEEAYFVATSPGEPADRRQQGRNASQETRSWVVGILAPQQTVETRFELIARTAEISREFFGTAGALEVYDDLHVESSASWRYFRAEVPFYIRERSLFASARERNETRSYQNDDGQDPGYWNSMANLTGESQEQDEPQPAERKLKRFWNLRER